MGCRILEDPEEGACFFDSVTGQAFGPVMSERGQLESFQGWLEMTQEISDPRTIAPAQFRNLIREWTVVYEPESPVQVGQVWLGSTGNRLVIREIKDGRARFSYVDDPGDEWWESVDDIVSAFTLASR